MVSIVTCYMLIVQGRDFKEIKVFVYVSCMVIVVYDVTRYGL